MFKKDQWRPGERTVYVKFERVQAACRTAFGTSRRQGRPARPRRMDQRSPIRRPSSTRWLNGEIDCIEQPAHRAAVARLKGDPEHQGGRSSIRWATRLASASIHAAQAVRRSEDPSRRVLCVEPGRLPHGGIRQPEVLQESARRCSSAARHSPSTKGIEDKLNPDFAKSKAMLKEAGYDGTPIVLLYSTDLPVRPDGPIIKSLLERGGSRWTCSRWTGKGSWHAARARSRRRKGAGTGC